MDGDFLSKRPRTDLNEPVEIDAGHAAVLAEALRAAGYSRCVAADVSAELAKPGRERSYVGRVATSLLKRAVVKVLAARWLGLLA
jgi:hypothetical protein